MALETLLLDTRDWFFSHVVGLTLVSALVAFVVYVIGNEVIRSRARLRGMGGPKGLPLIGNLWDIRINAAEKYEEWAKKYGEVYQVQMGNVPIVVVNSAAAVKTLWMSNAQALSSRPTAYTFHKVSLALHTQSPKAEACKRLHRALQA
jgi:3-hydroxyphenylacetate 6-hydroxylase